MLICDSVSPGLRVINLHDLCLRFILNTDSNSLHCEAMYLDNCNIIYTFQSYAENGSGYSKGPREVMWITIFRLFTYLLILKVGLSSNNLIDYVSEVVQTMISHYKIIRTKDRI